MTQQWRLLNVPWRLFELAERGPVVIGVAGETGGLSFAGVCAKTTGARGIQTLSAKATRRIRDMIWLFINPGAREAGTSL